MSEPIEDRYEAKMNALAYAIDEFVNGERQNADEPKKVGFVLLMFDFGLPDRSRMNYISNGERESIIVAMKELIARFEGRMPEHEGHA